MLLSLGVCVHRRVHDRAYGDPLKVVMLGDRF